RGLHEGALHRLDGALVATVPPAAEPAGQLEHAVAAAAGLETSFDAHCCDSSVCCGLRPPPVPDRARSCVLLRQPVRQRLLQMPLVAALEDLGAAQVALALAVLAQGQVVAAERLGRLDLARPGGAEPLHGAPLRLQLRHRGSYSVLRERA